MLFIFEGPNFKGLWLRYAISACPRTALPANRVEDLRESQEANVILSKTMLIYF